MKISLKRIFTFALVLAMICSFVPLRTSAVNPADIPLNEGAVVTLFKEMTDDKVREVLFEQLVADPQGAGWRDFEWEIYGKSYSDTIAGEPMSRWNWGNPITGFSWTEKITLTTHGYHVNPLKYLSDGTYSIRLKGSETKVTMEKRSFQETHTHAGIRNAGQAPTCAADGWGTYYRCACGRYYEDADCTVEIPDFDAWKTGSGKLNKLGHVWNDTTYAWGPAPVVCTASRTCKNCTTEESAKANITSEITRQPTCGTPGEALYTAAFSVDWADNQTRSFENVEKLPHRWGEPTYTWADDCSSCTARRVCENDPAHVEEAVSSNVSRTVNTPASCEASGNATFTAVFSETWAAEQTKEMDVPALGHDFGSTVYNWAADGSACTAERTCKRDPAHKEEISATVTSEVSAKPTCTAKGSTIYTASFSESWAAEQTRELVDLPAMGHTIEEQPRIEPTCTKDGHEQHWKCSRCGKLFSDAQGIASLTAVPLLPATGHSWSDWTEDTAPACTQAGQESRTCSKCTEKEIHAIPALGHVLELQPRVAPTCTEGGHEQYWKCSRCGTLFSDAQGVSALEAVPLLPAAGHSWGDWTTVDKPTCTEPGLERRTCRTDSTHTESRPIPAVGHTADKLWQTDDTGHWQTCTVCGARLEEAKHSFQWVVDFPAQNAKPGSRHQECTVCHYKRPDEVIPAYTADGEDSWPQNSQQGLSFTASSPVRKVSVGGKALKSTDYELDGTRLTLKTEYLEMLKPSCSYTLTLLFDGGSLDLNFVTGPYSVIEGGGSSFQTGTSKEGLRFRTNGAFRKFTSILVDGTAVDERKYTAEEGSTIITLSPAYLKTLKSGTHTLTVQYSDGACQTSFTTKGRAASSNPKTGDSTPPLLLPAGFGLTALAAAVVLTAVTVRKHRQDQRPISK